MEKAKEISKEYLDLLTDIENNEEPLIQLIACSIDNQDFVYVSKESHPRAFLEIKVKKEGALEDE